MTTYEQLKEIIVKEIPEIMELKFGCRLDEMVLNGDDKGCGGIVIKDFREDMLYLEIDKGEQLEFSVRFDDVFNCKIIGRDISLEDVLIVLTENGGNRWNMVTYKNGKMAGKISMLREDFKKFINWQLGKPLHEQSEETLKYLLEVLSK